MIRAVNLEKRYRSGDADLVIFQGLHLEVAQGEKLAAAHFRFPPDALDTATKIPLPLEIRNDTRRVAIENVDSAGAVQLLGNGEKRRAVEIVSARNAEDEQPAAMDRPALPA